MVVAEADLVIIGTDPILSAVVAVPSKFLRPGLRIVHWCHDLYPEAAVADGILKPGPLLNLLRRVMAASYRKIDLLADLGECMGRRLAEYGSSASRVRLWPWAIAEPAVVPEIDSVQRAAVFGHSRLAILYSGNFGRAHSFTELLTIARQMRDVDAHFSFGIRGNRLAEVQKAITKDDHNVSVAPFAPADELQARLSCADIHVVSLRPEWSGTVVPSKFFGALATGRPVLFIGSEECSIAQIIKRYGLGWVCSEGEEGQMAQHLRVLANDMSSLGALQERCHRVYRTCFSREILLDAFDQDLRNLWLALQDGGAEAKRPAVFADGGSLERK
jgi:glycosyltransferase involved in cell wall biosynthesis